MYIYIYTHVVVLFFLMVWQTSLALPDWFVPVVSRDLRLTGPKNNWHLALDCWQFLDHHWSSSGLVYVQTFCTWHWIIWHLITGMLFLHLALDQLITTTCFCLSQLFSIVSRKIKKHIVSDFWGIRALLKLLYRFFLSKKNLLIWTLLIQGWSLLPWWKSLEELRRCEERREKVGRREMSWHERRSETSCEKSLRKHETSWDKMIWDKLKRPTWEELGRAELRRAARMEELRRAEREDFRWAEKRWERLGWDEMRWHGMAQAALTIMRWAISKRSCDAMKPDEVRKDRSSKEMALEWRVGIVAAKYRRCARTVRAQSLFHSVN